MRRSVIVLALAFALTPLAATQARAGQACQTAYTVGKKAGVFPLYGNYGEIETLLAEVCRNTP